MDDWYPYHDFGEKLGFGRALDDWSIDYGHSRYGQSDAYEHLGGGLFGPRTDYFGAGYEPFGVMDPFVNGADDSMEYHSGRHGFGISRRGEAFEIPPRQEKMIRNEPDFGFGDEYRWPPTGSRELSLASEFSFLNSENPRDEQYWGSGSVPPWHAARRNKHLRAWG